VAAVPLDYGEHVLRHSLGLVATLVLTDELVEAWGAPRDGAEGDR
jgi:hypothetical protein